MRFVLLAASLLTLGCAADPHPESRRAWTLVYHLAYDGDLDRWSEEIVQRLARAADAGGPAVVVQADRRDDLGMTRWVFDGGPWTPEPWDSEAGADPASITALLDFAEERARAERYAVFLVGHGGGLGEYGYDEHPEPGGPVWMDVGEAARAIARFDARSKGSVELLYLQQCGRAHLATLAEVGVGAKVILASQGDLGAPNAYYGPAIASLIAHPDADGPRLARTIIDTEAAAMFEDLVAYDGTLLATELALRFAPVRAAIQPPRGDGIPTVHTTAGRRYVDAAPWLRVAYAEAELAPAPADEFLRWFSYDVILHRRTSPLATRAAYWSGASLRVATGD